MSYKVITREDTLWAGDYIGCGRGLGYLGAEAPVVYEGYTIAQKGSGSTTYWETTIEGRAVRGSALQTVKDAIDNYLGGRLSIKPIEPVSDHTAPAGQVPDMRIDTYKSWAIWTRWSGGSIKYFATKGATSSPEMSKDAVYRWVDQVAARPPASGPATVRPAAPPAAPVAKGKGLLTAAGIAAAAYMLLG